MTSSLVAVMGRGVVGDEPVITPDDLGFSRGDGCFDSARVLTDEQGARVVNLDEHLDRLASSAAALDIDIPARERWVELVDQALSAWSTPGEAVMKFVLTRGREWEPQAGPLALLTLREKPVLTPRPTPAGQVPRALHAVTLTTGHPSDAFRDAPWLLGGVKTLSYVTNVAAAREAKRRGADDAIMVTTDGYALEGPTSGLVVVSDGVMRTAPTGDTGILASVTVDEVMRGAAADGMETRVELVPVADLFTADGVFLVSSGRGPCPIVELDGRPLPVDAELAARVARAAGF
ncbi:aminodeoxychorismate lyase [Luteococcus peritonei]|uniref:Aminodeoxychorismate lyase n=1 Tax=Luteococcus peritonei TaxID=88874 RepID=A0ABW4RUN9_9ACTN